MKTSLVRSLAFLAGLAVLGLLCTAAPARADLTIYAVEGGASPLAPPFPPPIGDKVATASGAPTSDLLFNTFAIDPLHGTVQFGDFSVKVGSAEANQGALAQLLGQTMTITNTDSAKHVLHVVLAGTGYTAPVRGYRVRRNVQ